MANGNALGENVFKLIMKEIFQILIRTFPRFLLAFSRRKKGEEVKKVKKKPRK